MIKIVDRDLDKFILIESLMMATEKKIIMLINR